MKILTVGATGEYAGFVVPELKKRGATVRALIRKADRAEAARKQGADETVIGDLNDVESLKRATEGVEGVFHLNPAFAPNEAELGVSMVRAAKASGVRKFAFSGVIHPTISGMTNHGSKIPVEEAIYESGMVFAVLQPAMFMQTIASGWKQVLQHGRFSLPYSKHTKACYVDYRDVAEAAAIALTSDKLDYGTFELCAPGMVDRVELTKIMSEALGRPVQAGEVAYDEWAQTAQVPEGPLRDGLRRMYAHYDKYGFPGGNALVLRAVLGRQPRSLQNFFAELAKGADQMKASAARN
jgi:uncharacterized protein YbjT (DUF2867 family)